MAGEERRMLFDIRGRGRKNVIRVVYACLALLMGASLFVAVGPFNLAEFFGNGGTTSAAEISEEQAENIEKRLRKNPQDEQLLLSLIRTRIGAGRALAQENTTTGAVELTPESIEQYEAAQEAWLRYRKQAGDEANPTTASLVASTYFNVAEHGESLGDIEESITNATKAQQVAAEATPNLHTLTTLAIFQYFNGEFAAGEKSAQQATKEATSKSQAKSIEKQMAGFRKRAQGWQKQRKKLAKQASKQGKEKLENPLGGLSGGSSTTLTP
jgi:tetratricopeptide (TPR) repeat protein